MRVLSAMRIYVHAWELKNHGLNKTIEELIFSNKEMGLFFDQQRIGEATPLPLLLSLLTLSFTLLYLLSLHTLLHPFLLL